MRFAEPWIAGWEAVRRSKRLIALSALTTGVVSLPFAIWFGRQVDASGARRLDATDAARAFDADFFADVRRAIPSFDADAAALVVAALALAFVVRPLVWGGYTGIAASRKRLRFSKFVREGGASYWKFMRLSMLGLVLLFAVSVALKPLLETFSTWAERAPSEDMARSRTLVGEALAFLALSAVPMVLDYARVGVRMRRRPGVLAELGRSALFVIQHPFRTAGFHVTVLVLEVLACLPVLLLVRISDGAYIGTSFIVLLLGQVAIAVREACRLFHVAGAWRIRAAAEAPALAPPPAGNTPDILDEPLPWHAR